MNGRSHHPLIEACVRRALALEEEIELVESIVAGGPGSTVVRVFIYKPDGVTVDDCARINRRLSRELESHAELDRSYSIEVSSPGLDRKLTSRRDFERVLGEVLKLQVRELDGRERTVRGRLTDVEEEALLLEPLPASKGEWKERRTKGAPFRVALDRIVVGTIEVLL